MPASGHDSQMIQLFQAFRLLLTVDLTRQELARRLHPPVSERTAARILRMLEQYAPELRCTFHRLAPADIGKTGDSRVRYYRIRRRT